jgi:DNA modification methylase
MTVTLHLGDCLEYMKTLPDGCVDAVVTDPPYGLNIEYGVYADTQENLSILVPQFTEQVRRIARLAVVFPGIHNVQMYPQADWIGCWFYGTTGNFGKFGYNAWQPFLLYGRNNNRYGMDTIKYSRMEPRVEGHPCSKPIGLMAALVKRFTSEGAIVFDPFMGSGTTGVACVQTGRNFVGCEISEPYFKIAQKRIAQAQAQLHIPFDPT